MIQISPSLQGSPDLRQVNVNSASLCPSALSQQKPLQSAVLAEPFLTNPAGRSLTQTRLLYLPTGHRASGSVISEATPPRSHCVSSPGPLSSISVFRGRWTSALQRQQRETDLGDTPTLLSSPRAVLTMNVDFLSLTVIFWPPKMCSVGLHGGLLFSVCVWVCVWWTRKDK